MNRLFYPLPEIPGYHVVHVHDAGDRCVRNEQGLGCFYLRATRLTRLRQRVLRLFRSAP